LAIPSASPTFYSKKHPFPSFLTSKTPIYSHFRPQKHVLCIKKTHFLSKNRPKTTFLPLKTLQTTHLIPKLAIPRASPSASIPSILANRFLRREIEREDRPLPGTRGLRVLGGERAPQGTGRARGVVGGWGGDGKMRGDLEHVLIQNSAKSGKN
jgi:hypothetical protein